MLECGVIGGSCTVSLRHLTLSVLAAWCYDNFVNRRSMNKILQVRAQLREMYTRMDLPLQSCGECSIRF